MSNKAKTGRKQKHFPDPKTGLPVIGLSRRPSDGRWRIIGTQITFTEPDPQKAIEQYRKLSGERKYEGMPAEEVEWLTTPASTHVGGNAATAIIRGFALVGKPKEAWRKFWAYVASEIQSRPKWVAERTGIEKIGYLTDIKPPEKLPTFKEIETAWKEHFTKSAEQRRRVLHAWADFKRTTAVAGLADITPATAIAYRDAIYAQS